MASESPALQVLLAALRQVRSDAAHHRRVLAVLPDLHRETEASIEAAGAAEADLVSAIALVAPDHDVTRDAAEPNCWAATPMSLARSLLARKARDGGATHGATPVVES